MKKKTWKRCVCMIGVVLFAVTGLNANNRVPDSPIKKTRSNTTCTARVKKYMKRPSHSAQDKKHGGKSS